MYTWTTNIRYVRGIGPTRARELNGMGIETVGDLLEHQPLHYIYPGATSIADAQEGHVIIKAEIRSINRLPSHVTIAEAKLNDGTGTCKAQWFNNLYALQSLRPGMTVTFWGKFKGGVLQQPRFSTCGLNAEEVAGGYYGTHHETVRMALREVFKGVELSDWSLASDGLYSQETLMFRSVAFKQLHWPIVNGCWQAALHRLKFDELFLMQLAMLKKREGSIPGPAARLKCNKDRILHKGTNGMWELGYFPYEFTEEQNLAIADIVLDLNCGKKTTPMSRLLHGEVGSGKTAVAFYAAMLTALNGKRTLILCPTTILAQQHYDTLRGMGWEDVDIIVSGHNSGSFWDGEKRIAPGHINFVANYTYGGGSDKDGDHHIIIGTHAILNNESLLKSASLVIIDEFQKFGVEQRARLQKHHPHLLLMSATPIPRSLAASVFGDLDISTIRQLPIERGTVVTRWVLPDRREQMYEIIDGELAKGKQVYVVYPRINGGEDVVSANRGFVELSKRFSSQYNYEVEFLTGQSKSEDKAWLLKQFRLGHINILVSTIIAEVGLDCPNASVMVIEGADRFGLSQLHQLRGRVCRSTDTTFCFLVSKTANPTSIARLEVMEKCNDGFEIAEYDLRLRGPGELFSTRQHGLPDLKFASLVDDYDLLVKARELAQEYIHKLDEPANAGLKEMLEIKYSDVLQFGGVA